MTQRWMKCFAVAVLALLGGGAGLAAAPAAAPDFQEIYGLIRAHLSGVSDAELNRAAVQGLLAALGPKVSLVQPGAATNAATNAPPLSQSRIFEGNIGYLRIVRVGDDVAADVRDACQRLGTTNPLKGLVLDLRYAGGDDYAAAAATADLFVDKAEPLANWGAGMVSSHAKTNAIRLPVAVLVNHRTARAAELLAALMRETGAALILGSPTAGAAMVSKDFPLSNGGQLRVASGPVKLGDGAELSARGVVPDIRVAVPAGQERDYYANAFFTPATNRQAALADLGDTSGFPPYRLNEAELVREHDAGLNHESEIDTPPAAAPERRGPLVKDPALARALDVLTGLAVVRQDRF